MRQSAPYLLAQKGSIEQWHKSEKANGFKRIRAHFEWHDPCKFIASTTPEAASTTKTLEILDHADL